MYTPEQSSERSEEPKEAKEAQGMQPARDLIRQGLIYPPPPSFYQQNDDIVEQVVPDREIPPVQMHPGLLPAPERYRASAAQPAVKKSRKWIWITASILGVLLIAVCSLCGWGVYNLSTQVIEPATNTVNVANDYYAALKNKDYATAYQYLRPAGSIKGMTQQTFMQHVQEADAQHGVLNSYTTTPGNFVSDSTTGLDMSRFTVTVAVTRSKQNYTALLTLQKIGASWKIIDFDRI